MKLFEIILKWTTNITTILILGLVLYIVGAHLVEGFPESNNLTPTEIKLSISMGFLFLGALIGLKWRKIGGSISIISFVVFAIVQQELMLGIVFNIFLVIGISNLILAWLKNKNA